MQSVAVFLPVNDPLLPQRYNVQHRGQIQVIQAVQGKMLRRV